ncbi:hypothetical protein DL769_006597 [Monosporascus sp. CRB-8-3]|nr:hypothetical protein DL769_006597 [Monosporascus sp. CRB-8-3]
MSDAPTPTSPADPIRNSSPDRRREDIGARAPAHASNQSSSASAPGHEQPQPEDGDTRSRTRAQRPSLSQKAKEGLSQKLRFLIHLVYTLDTLVHAELCVLYYMDCSFFRLMIRWIAQALFISPRAEDTFLNVPNYHVSAIVAPNIICIFLHLVTSLPFAGEASRGYLHGGVLIDFIGQKAPTSKLSLLLLDFMILGIQCLMLAVNMEKERIRKVVKPPRVSAATAGSTETPQTTQDHDSEERGVLRDAPTLDESNDIEMRSLRSDRHDSVGGTSLSTGTGSEYEGLLDALRSGNAILSTFHIRRALRDTWNNRGNTPESATAYAIQSVGYNATLAALAARRRARLAAAHRR